MSRAAPFELSASHVARATSRADKSRGVRRVRRAGLIGAALVGAVLLSGCSADVTQPKVQKAFGAAFRRLYIQQLDLEGKQRPVPLLQQVPHSNKLRVAGFYTAARCRKGARHSPQTGAGDDWSCIAYFQRSNGAIAEADYEVTVRTDGCLVATGPAQVVGAPDVQAKSGRTVVNPLSQFYACFTT